jgi:hypothetical protein
MKTEELIGILVRDVEPVRRLPSRGRWHMLSLVEILSLIAIGTWLLGFRSDLASKAGDIRFLLQSMSLFIVGVTSARSAIDLSVPGLERPGPTFLLPLATLLISSLTVLVPLWSVPTVADVRTALIGDPGNSCFLGAILLGSLPALLVLWQVRKAAPVKRRWAAAFAGLTAFSFAAIGIQFSCGDDDPAHVLLWHFVPFTLLSLVMIGAARGLTRGKPEVPDQRERAKSPGC